MPSHGSLTKAGKVRTATPKIPPKGGKNVIPRRRNRRNYLRKIVYPSISQIGPEPRATIPKKSLT